VNQDTVETALSLADYFANRLCRDALWSGSRCNWLGDSMEPVDDDLHEAAGEVVTQRRIRFTLLPHSGAFELEGVGRLNRCRPEVPYVGRKHPRPAQHRPMPQ